MSKVKVREKTLLALSEQSGKAAVYFKGFGWVKCALAFWGECFVLMVFFLTELLYNAKEIHRLTKKIG